MRSFTTDWADEIVQESTKPEYQNAEIRLHDESLVTSDYDVETGEWTVVGNGDIYTGPARIIGVRWGVFHGGESQANASTEKAIRVQLPFQAVGRVKKGVKVFIESCPRNPVLETYLFAVTSDFQGSMAGARTLECALDGDVEIEPDEPVAFGYGDLPYGEGPYGGFGE